MNNNNAVINFRTRFLKNKAAVVALLFILLAILLAVFGYFIAPDNSPNANRMIPEIGSKKPWFSTLLLKEKRQTINSENFFQILLNGKTDIYQYTPIVSYEIKNDSIIYQKFIDDGLTERNAIAVHYDNNKASVENAAKQFAQENIVHQKFYLGTDKFGRDILSRLIIGTRVSLSVGLIAVIISLTIGIFLGAVAGYFKGKTDDVVMWLLNVVWSIPALLLVFAITLVLGKGFWQVFIAVGLTMWVNVARLVRGQVMAAKELEYIEAAKVLGFSHSRIIIKHILPNIIGPILVLAAANFAGAIVIEAGLSFLGVGVQPPQPSWGLMIKENYNFIVTNNPMLALTPGIAIMLLVLAFNLLGNGLRDAMNVKST